MARARITVNQVPVTCAGAFLPPMQTSVGASSSGVLRTTGLFGPIPQPGPAAVPNVGETPRTNPSACAPSLNMPMSHVGHVTGLYPPVPIRSDNVVPVPAAKFNPVQIANPKRVRIGGRTVTRAARAITRWPTYTGGTTGGTS